jgi:hypothetical protein
MTRVQRALQIWQVLIAAAHNRQILTYELVSELIYGKKGAGTLAYNLGVIMGYCRANDLPSLTVLVVYKKMGQPGSGLTTVPVANINLEREKVYEYKWFRLPPVEVKDLEPYE